ncbi:MAG: hypothetical protein OXI67_03705 [Candidatus Poribacteria bacterium]|nr:hypothetical protein [Candidatus Poribacteria bacterium]
MNLNDVNLDDKTETVEKMVEGLLQVIKAEIQNLETEIGALNDQKSHLEDIYRKYDKIWRAVSDE